jgi:molybdopterin molybdotransferase
MDGFAVRWQDCQSCSKENPTLLEVIDDIPAGKASQKVLLKQQAMRIMTGAPIPDGADTVVPIEDTKGSLNRVQIFSVGSKGKHIRKSGEDIKKNQVVFRKGSILTPACLGVLASIGQKQVKVYAKPKVAFFSTGDELVPYTQEPEGAQIVNSNSPLIASCLCQLGCVPVDLGICQDSESTIRKTLELGFDQADVVVSFGGISVGDYDFVQRVFEVLSGDIHFWRVAMKPGKPFLYGHLKQKPFFALPGNPVSVGVLYEEFVRPALLKIMGYECVFRPVFQAIAQEDLEDSEKRTCFLRGILEQKDGRYTFRKTGLQGAHVLSGMAGANAFGILPRGIAQIKKGETFGVQVLSPFAELQSLWPGGFPE